MLKNRPAAFLCLVFSAGIAAGLFLDFSYMALIISVCAICIVLLLYKAKATKMTKWALLTVAALFIGVFYAELFVTCSAPTEPDKDTKYTFTAAVRDTQDRDSYVLMEAEVQDGQSVFDGHVFCMYLYNSAPKAGDVIKVTGRVSVGSSHNRANGVKYVVYGEYELCPDKTPSGFYFNVLHCRQWVGNVIEKAYGGETAGFYKALLVGDKSGLTTEFNADFSRSGLSHIMAISGQHFSLIIINAYVLLMALFGRKKLCSIIAILLAIAYTVFTGASPSIVRAAFMCCSMFAASIFDEESDPITNLSVVLVVLLLFNPFAILNASLQLSFLATLGIIFTFYHIDRFYDKHKIPRAVKAIIEPIAMSVTASLFCTPVFLSRFDYISILAPLSNILVNWLVSAAMLCGIALIIPAIIISEIGFVTNALYTAIREIAAWVAGLRYACISADMPYIKLLFLPSLFCFFTFGFFRPKRGVAVLCGTCIATIFIIVGCFGMQHSNLKNNALLYVKDGDTSYYAFYADESMAVLIDGKGAIGASKTVTEQGHTYIDVYVVTTCTENTAARLERTMPYTPVNTVYVPKKDNEYTAEIIRVATDKGCKVVRYGNNRLRLGGMTVYTDDNEYGNGGYIINANKNGSCVSVISILTYNEDYKASPCDALVITRVASKGNLVPILTDYSYDRIIFYHDYDSLYYNYASEDEPTRIIEHYSGNLLLRVGNSGVIKE